MHCPLILPLLRLLRYLSRTLESLSSLAVLMHFKIMFGLLNVRLSSVKEVCSCFTQLESTIHFTLKNGKSRTEKGDFW